MTGRKWCSGKHAAANNTKIITMNYFQKNRRNILLITGGIVLFTVLLILGIRKKEYTSEDIVASISSNNLKIGEVLTFEDKSPFGNTRKWILNDGYTTTARKGEHIFKKDGFYNVTLIIDNNLTKTFPVLVSAAGPTSAARVPTLIDGPSQAMQLENVVFKAVTADAKMFTWKFGETGNIDSKDKTSVYTFKNPGTYIVRLYTDTDTEPIEHSIRILPAYPVIKEEPVIAPPPPTEEEVFSKINDDFRQHLQQIANGNNFNFHYNYLLRTYLCNRDNVSVTANDKNSTFYYYCTGLQFDKNNLIQEVTTTVDTGQNCVTKVEVKQTKQ